MVSKHQRGEDMSGESRCVKCKDGWPCLPFAAQAWVEARRKRSRHLTLTDEQVVEVVDAAAGLLDLYALTPDAVLERWRRLKHALAALTEEQP